MAINRYLRKTCILVALGAASLRAQTPASGNTSAGAPPTPASSGTYSIESEILAYKSLAANSDAISGEVAGLLSSGSGAGGVVIVPSFSTILPSFQLWRSNILVAQTFIRQAHVVLAASNGCPAQTPRTGELPSFSIYAAGVQQGVGVLQSILALFATNQGVTEFGGSIQDQALISAVARRLRAQKLTVLTPDILAPSTIAPIEGNQFPFIVLFRNLVDVHSHLQNAYQCNQIALAAATQLQQAEIARDKDYQKLIDPLVSTPAQQQPILDDIHAQNSLIGFLRPKIGLAAEDMTAIIKDESTISSQGRIVADLAAVNRAAALILLQSAETDISSHENPAITALTLKAAGAQSLVAGIEAYLAGLTGGAVNFTPPSSSTPTLPATAIPVSPGSPAPANPSQAPGGGSPGPSGGGGPTPSPSSAASPTPPIMTILQVDGLAGKMGFRVTDPDSPDTDKPGLAFAQLDAWRILWLKSMESGGAIITKTSVWGSHPYFGGGAVSGYALFTLEGDLLCSGNTATYGGYVRAADFTDKGGSQLKTMLQLGSTCKAP